MQYNWLMLKFKIIYPPVYEVNNAKYKQRIYKACKIATVAN